VRVDTDPSMAIIGDNVNLDTRGGLSGILRARLFFCLAVGRRNVWSFAERLANRDYGGWGRQDFFPHGDEVGRIRRGRRQAGGVGIRKKLL